MVPTERAYERATEGSEKPTDVESGERRVSRPSAWTADPTAYRERHVFRIPSAQVFFGRGDRLFGLLALLLGEILQPAQRLRLYLLPRTYCLAIQE